MLLELCKKQGVSIIDSDEEAIRTSEWEERLKTAHPEELQKSVEEMNYNIKNITRLNANFPAELISDGYHTFKELYEFRMLYKAALFNELVNKIGNRPLFLKNVY